MEWLVAIAIIAVLGSNVVWLQAYRDRERAHSAETRELITRIIHPELVPVEAPDLPPDPDPDPDEYEQVGMVEGGEQLDGDGR